MNQTDREMGLLAKATLKANPSLGFVAKCQRGLAANEKAMTVVTFVNGKEARCWNNSNGRQVSNLARQKRADVVKVEYVICDTATKAVLRTVASFRLNGLDLIAE